MFVEGLDRLVEKKTDRCVMFVSNHRSLFDQYALMLAVWMGPTPWARNLFFPVRSNYFYENPLGLLVNFSVGGGSMYPPVFRQPERAARNRDALGRLVEVLRRPDTVVGMHPEGTRNRGGDPCDLLPAQPGCGQIALRADPLVIPVFLLGLTDNLFGDARQNYRRGIRRTWPCICVIGTPIDFSDLARQTPRPALYKRTADRFRDEIARLGPRERELRQMCRSGAIADDHPGWLSNRPVGRLYARIGPLPACAPRAAAR
jgi:1-acyl-sn-glycerol-3-phosphate acyltransferase